MLQVKVFMSRRNCGWFRLRQQKLTACHGFEEDVWSQVEKLTWLLVSESFCL